jgi:hypothetical protein
MASDREGGEVDGRHSPPLLVRDEGVAIEAYTSAASTATQGREWSEEETSPADHGLGPILRARESRDQLVR